jgi:hypothetical protein
MGDVLEILLRKVDPATLDAQDRAHIEDFQYQLRRVQSMKARRKTGAVAAQQDRGVST